MDREKVVEKELIPKGIVLKEQIPEIPEVESFDEEILE